MSQMGFGAGGELVPVRYRITVEGGEESMAELQTFLGGVQKGIGLLARFDYLAMSWERAAHKMDLRSFLSVTLSTISMIQMLIKLTRSATIAQQAYNVALAIGKALSGPWGWLALGLGTAGGTYMISQMLAQSPSESFPTAEEIRGKLVEETRKEIEAARREQYRSIVPG